ncbi:MAG: biopolymer transporter ExbD [Bacteroides sp.]|nr:biopolymer transporter ExbD [Bacteroides sp.]
MALKRQFDMSATFSMASMTDVIFLLLIFFMVTSTFVFPNALEVNLPESSTQTTLKPSARIYLDAQGHTATMYGEGADWQMLDSIDNEGQLQTFFAIVRQQETEENPTSFVALYADREVPYGRVVEMLNAGSENNVRIVLATAAPNK